MRNRGQRNHAHRGIAAVWTAMLLLLLIGLVGLGVDTGHVLLGAHRLQNAADAAALAAAIEVRGDLATARTAAIQCGLANAAAGSPVQLTPNEANAPDGDIVFGHYDRDVGLFTPTVQAPNAVRVVARRIDGAAGGRLPLIFGRIFGVEGVNLARHAVAMIGGGTGAGMIALNGSVPNALTVSGSVSVDVEGGAIQVNSSDVSAVLCNGGPELLAPDLNVAGDVRFLGGVDFDGNLNTGASPVDDPLNFLPELSPDPAADQGTVTLTSGAVDLEPGYYSGGISATGGTLTCAPGIYILDGAGLDVGGNASLLAEGVMFYITGGGCVDVGGTGEIVLTPPDPGEYSYPGVDTYEGVSIFQDPDNTSSAKIIGTSLLDMTGTLYFPSAHVELSGTGDGFGSQLIADTITVSGTGQIVVNYDGRFPAPGNRVFLVE